ncbi:hypothetical protein E6W39_17835 [Kitasatospora acidiphila]|uniref:Uncharacterized protein n=1 Tax=Kitasatospora acidiphila TaxID=2567942 RepID=A0A540W451_9ACTN|nr:hypothetical protein E6W39_17835 [Kitasatospora acidiphila]
MRSDEQAGQEGHLSMTAVGRNALRAALEEAIDRARGGDQAAVERAGELFEEADYWIRFELNREYAGLGEPQRERVAACLVQQANDNLGLPRSVTARINALADLGPTQFPRARQLLRSASERHILGAFRRPVKAIDPAFRAAVVAEALRSLRADPGRFLPHRSGDWLLLRTDRVVDELAACGADVVEQLGTALEELAASPEIAALLRWRAAAALERIDPGAGRSAAAQLTEAGVQDPGEPGLDAGVVARVNDAWQRIEAHLQVHSPELLDRLGPPLSPQDAAICRQVLGIPDAFTASLARHRSVWLREEFDYEDIRRHLDDFFDDSWYNHGDWGDLNDLVFDDEWLESLCAYAERLEASV